MSRNIKANSLKPFKSALGGILTAYNFKEHVASDIAVDQLFLNPSNLKTQENLIELQKWTDTNLMRLNGNKTNYI